jgi:hypothetical protein
MYDSRETIQASTLADLKEFYYIDKQTLGTWAERFVEGNESKTSEDMEDLIVSMLIEMCDLSREMKEE